MLKKNTKPSAFLLIGIALFCLVTLTVGILVTGCDKKNDSSIEEVPSDGSTSPPSDTSSNSTSSVQITFDNYICEKYGNDSIVIIKVVSKSKVPANLIIPEAIENIPVVALGSGLFFKYTTLNTVTMNSITRIEATAFKNCTALTQVDAPNLLFLDSEVFKECYKLNTVSIPKVKNIGNDAFYDCGKLSTLNINSVISIGSNAFWGIKDNLTSLGGPPIFTSLSMPNVVSIGSGAFKNSQIRTISLPKLTSLGEAAFSSSKVSSITLPLIKTLSSMTFQGCNSLTQVSRQNFPVLTTIGDKAFSSCTALSSITFQAVTTIGTSSFERCTSLTRVTLANCKTLGEGAFKDCKTVMTDVDISSVSQILINAFYMVSIPCGTNKLKMPDPSTIYIGFGSNQIGYENGCLIPTY